MSLSAFMHLARATSLVMSPTYGQRKVSSTTATMHKVYITTRKRQNLTQEIELPLHLALRSLAAVCGVQFNVNAKSGCKSWTQGRNASCASLM